MSNRRERYLRREAERKARNTQQPVSQPPVSQPEVIPARHSAEIDAEYAAYLASLDDEAEHWAYLDSLGEPAERQRPQKEKITWHPNHKQGDNWHDYLACLCRECTSFRKANGIDRWIEKPGEPDPWAEPEGDTET